MKIFDKLTEQVREQNTRNDNPLYNGNSFRHITEESQSIYSPSMVPPQSKHQSNHANNRPDYLVIQT